VTDKDAFAERGRTLEEDYFRRKEKEVIEKMRRSADAEAQRQRLGEQTGVADAEVLRDLQELGYTAETVMLLHLVPLIQTAWAEGSVSEQERDLIVQAARSRGVEPGSAADQQLGRWLSARPSDELFDKTLRAIQTILLARPPKERAESERDLLSLATAIASASGGILGFGAVSEDERAILARISQALDKGTKP
jgi:tellurite resistance protein